MKTKQLKAVIASTVMGVVSPLAMIVPASAATQSWSGFGEGGDTSASSSVNWFTSVPSNGDNLVFSAAANAHNADFGTTSLGLVGIAFNGEVPSSSSKSTTLTGTGTFTLTGNISSAMTGAGGENTVNTNITLGSASTFSTAGTDTLTIGGTGKTLDLAGNNLALDASGGTITIQGEIDGVGNLSTSGKVNFLATAGATYNPTVTIADGEFSASSTTRGNFVVNGGMFKGTSELLGSFTLNDGTLAPGNSPGCITVTSLTLAGGTYNVEINGSDVVCTDYDSVTVNGAVALGSATTLDVVLGADNGLTVGDQMAVILNDAADAVTGTFQGLAEGATVTVDGYTMTVSYVGGDGNDVVLTVTGVPATPTTPDTGIGSLISNPLVTMFAAIAALSGFGALRYAEAKKSRK